MGIPTTRNLDYEYHQAVGYLCMKPKVLRESAQFAAALWNGSQLIAHSICNTGGGGGKGKEKGDRD